MELVCAELLSNSNAASMSRAESVVVVAIFVEETKESVEFIRRFESSDRGCLVVVGVVVEEVAQQDPYEFENLCDESNSDAAAALSLSSFAKPRADIKR